MNKNKTYGQSVVEHDARRLDFEDDLIEYRRVMENDIVRNIHETAEKATQNSLYKHKDFYVVMLMKVERIGQVPQTIIFARQSCPTPVYKQSVWKYHHIAGTLEFLWSIPDSFLYYHIINNTQKYLADKECADIAKFVILMESGELLDWVKRENGEKIDAVIKITEEGN
jgi:hypothetical protein